MQAARTVATSIPPKNPLATLHKSRNDLLILATNRYCDSDAHDRLSMEQFKEAFYLLIEETDFPTRQIVARNLAHCPATPRPVVLYFALETIEIARAMLANSSVIGQLDMLRVIEMKGVSHARIVAGRPDIGPSVVKRLRELGDEEVNRVLDNNRALVHNTAPPAADELFRQILARHGETANSLHETRDEKAVSAAPGSSELSTQSFERTQTAQAPSVETPETFGEQSTAAEEKMPTSAEQSLLTAAARGGRLGDIRTEIKPLPATHFDFGDAFEKLARTRSHQAMAALMQKRFGVSFDTAYQVLEDKSGDTLAVLLRAAEVEAAQANRIQLLTHPAIGLSVHNAMRAVRFYEKLKTESCLTAVDQWPKDQSSSAVHQPYLEEGRSTPRKEVATTEAHRRIPVDAHRKVG